MDKPRNPYRVGTRAWAVMEGDWEGLTVNQIAEVLDYSSPGIRSYLSKIKRDTGYIVPHQAAKGGAEHEKETSV